MKEKYSWKNPWSLDWKKALMCMGLLVIHMIGFSQKNKPNPSLLKDTTVVDSLIKLSSTYFIEDQPRAIELAIEAKNIARKIYYLKGVAYSLKNIGIVYYYQENYFKALDYYKQSLEIFLRLKDNVGISNLYNNIGVIYYNQADYVRSLENHLLSLKYAELTNDKLRILTALNNVGGVYYIKPATMDKALEYYFKALPLCEELDNTNALGAIAVNIGNIYIQKDKDSLALEYLDKSLKAYGNSDGSQNVYISLGRLFMKEGENGKALISLKKALVISEGLRDNISTLKALTVLGNLSVTQAEYKKAIAYFKEAEKAASSLPPNDDTKDLYQAMAETYDKTGDYYNAYKYQTLFSILKDSIYNIAADRKLASLQFDFDLQKKEGEISLLTKDKELNQLQIKKQTFARNAFAAGLVLLFLIALLLFRSSRQKVKINKILDHKNDQIEHLLLNILPAEVARELQENGRSTPREFDAVSVLFTDFESFTRLTTNMNPNDLLHELNSCFMAFDEIISVYDLEKIKTIGDSYMCAGGIPKPDDKHPYYIVKAGLEIQKYISAYNETRTSQGLAPWNLRIGIHTGPLVAGVVGTKKYAYDIWGSTVNIASRMESNGEPGKVNISAQTYELIKDKFICRYRGKVLAKNVGEIDMYFVESEIEAESTKPIQGKVKLLPHYNKS